MRAFGVTEAQYVSGLFAVVFVPYLFNLGLLWVPKGWRKLGMSVTLFSHAVAIVAYVMLVGENVHRGDAGLGDVFLVLISVALNVVVSIIASAVFCARYKIAFLWLAVQLCGVA